MRRLTKNEIGAVIAVAVVIVTINAYWRVKETGRRAKWVAEHELLDAASDAGASEDGASE